MKGKKITSGYKGGAVSSGKSFDAMKPKSSGGKMPKKVHGESPASRLDKKGRGTASGSPLRPLSGAMPSGLPGGGSGKVNVGKENN